MTDYSKKKLTPTEISDLRVGDIISGSQARKIMWMRLHPVARWFVIILLAIIVALPPIVFFLASPAVALATSIGEIFLVMNSGFGAFLCDLLGKRGGSV